MSPSNPRSKQPLGPFPTCLPNTALLRGSPRKSGHLPSVILPADCTTQHEAPWRGWVPCPRPTTLGHSPFPSGAGVWACTLRPPGHAPTGQLPSVTPICPAPASAGKPHKRLLSMSEQVEESPRQQSRRRGAGKPCQLCSCHRRRRELAEAGVSTTKPTTAHPAGHGTPRKAQCPSSLGSPRLAGGGGQWQRVETKCERHQLAAATKAHRAVAQQHHLVDMSETTEPGVFFCGFSSEISSAFPSAAL